MKNIISAEICKKCGECCRHFPFIELSAKDIKSLEQLTALHPRVFTNKKEQAVGEYFLQFKENGDCFFLDKNKGCYSCGVYEARPKICQKYPAEPLQKKSCNANRGKLLTTQSAATKQQAPATPQFFRHFVATCQLFSFAKFFTWWCK